MLNLTNYIYTTINEDKNSNKFCALRNLIKYFNPFDVFIFMNNHVDYPP